MTATSLVPTNPAAPVDWNRELNGAKMLLKSGLLPDAIKTPETALFIILAGRDLGLSPVQALRSINIIKGKVEVAADQQLGLFHRAGGKSQWLKLTDTEAVLRLAAPWLIQPHDEQFTMADAKRAGLDRAGKSGEPSMFTKFPKAMLRSRAITAGLKSVGFDPTAGVYDYGEIGGPEPAFVPSDDMTQEKINERLTATDAGNGNDNGQAKAEASDSEVESQEEAALAEIEEMLPGLAQPQREYVRHKLGDGADPIALLERVKGKKS